MEENKEMKNGVISEEALDQIAGGLSVKKALLIGVLAAAGVGVVKFGYDVYEKVEENKTPGGQLKNEFKSALHESGIVRKGLYDRAVDAVADKVSGK